MTPIPQTTPAAGAPPHSEYISQPHHRPSSSQGVLGSSSNFSRSRTKRRFLARWRSIACLPPPNEICCSSAANWRVSWLMVGLLSEAMATSLGTGKLRTKKTSRASQHGAIRGRCRRAAPLSEKRPKNGGKHRLRTFSTLKMYLRNSRRTRAKTRSGRRDYAISRTGCHERIDESHDEQKTLVARTAGREEDCCRKTTSRGSRTMPLNNAPAA